MRTIVKEGKVFAVAAYFVRQASAESGDVITHLKLQKLLYYAQGWSLVLNNKQLFPNRIEAWAHGPVCPDVWKRFKKYEWNPIPSDAVELRRGSFSEIEEHLLGEVWRVYGQFSAKRLEEMTHEEDPYISARDGYAEYANCNEQITNPSMKTYFNKLKNGAKK